MTVVRNCVPVYYSGVVVGVTFVDPQDWELVSGRRWSMSSGYAQSSNGRHANVLLHRLVMGCVPHDGQEVDHKNRNRLDNRRSNLRIVTHAGNAQNKICPGGSSPFRGVTWWKTRRTWQARVTLNGRIHHLGLFDVEIEAARVAEAWRREHMPLAPPCPALVEAERHATVEDIRGEQARLKAERAEREARRAAA